MKTNNLGLPAQESETIIQHLNVLLSSFQIYYQNLRGLHWNIRGKRFFDLHLKFEELYNDAQIKIDLVAERVLTLNGKPMHTFDDYLKNAKVTAGVNISKDEEAVRLINQSLSELLVLERQLLSLSGGIHDEGTNNMMSNFISEQEKTIWMMNAWLD
ncbi:MAG: DNA starvation/stationary phase protection protein [Flavobacteriales bacterium CG_4_9_14_3_um_filter_40_17]|nr:MAG: DNA starvation/stationary phase protection protein [Flavobacteriales bacterium CG_4_9_14_3_um_filter_40_17]